MAMAVDLSPVRSLNSGLPGWNSLAFTLGEPLAKCFFRGVCFAFLPNSLLALVVFVVFSAFVSEQFFLVWAIWCEKCMSKKGSIRAARAQFAAASDQSLKLSR